MPAKRADTALLIACASLILLIHFLIGNGYGFHRDELQFLDDARHLQWGFVAYPPLTAFVARLAIDLFGISPQTLRLPAALVNAASLVLTGLIARELGGRRPAQLLALAATFPLTLVFSSVLQYNTFDLFAWLLLILFTARLLRTGDERNWIGAGLAIGLGVLSKYSVAFPVASLLAALVLLPSQRQHLRSRWFYLGALTAATIAAPNLLWLARHHFITLQMEHHIHLRDVRNGRAAGFFTDQLKFNLFALPLALAGLISLLRNPRLRLLAAFYVGPLILFALAKGRGYYLMPAYPALYAAGAVALEAALTHRTRALRISVRTLLLAGLLTNAALFAYAYLPIWHPGTRGWNWQMAHNSDMQDEIGWPELVARVAAVRDTLPAADRSHLAVLANNYGEAGALALYGPHYGLPTPIAPVNTFYDRGFGPFPPDTVILLGSTLEDEQANFASCTIAAHLTIPYNVRNEESLDHPEILLCRHLLHPWPEVWSHNRHFG